MSYLSREAISLPEGLWAQIDDTVVKAARRTLTGRRFLNVFGPLGAGVQSIAIDDAQAVSEVEKDGLVTITGRKYVQIPALHEDFTLLARDLETAEQTGFPLDLAKASRAADACALKEDKLIYFGNKELGITGLTTAEGAKKIKKNDWSSGENSFTDIASGITYLAQQGIFGTYSLAVSPDLYMQMQRLQPGTGLLEIDRVSKLVNGHIYLARALGTGKAVLCASDVENMDLVIGQDMATAYAEQVELNHHFRVIETILPRFKREEAIVVFE